MYDSGCVSVAAAARPVKAAAFCELESLAAPGLPNLKEERLK